MITSLKTHELCPVEIEQGPFGPHYARLRCKHHGVQIQWLSKQDFFCLENRAIINNTNNTNYTNDK